MPNFYCTREQVKRAAEISGSNRDEEVDSLIEAASREIERLTHTFFIPKTQTRTFRWPPRQSSESYVLWLDQWLLSVTTLQTKAQDSSPTTISSSDYFTEPNNPSVDGVQHFDRIEIDQSSTAAFEAGDTSQRSISVAGSWGYSNETKSTGTVASGLDSDAAATTMVCSDSSLIDVGDTLLIGSEQIFVSNRSNAALGSILVNDASITADMADNSITADGSHGLVAGEVILLDSEKLLITAVATNVLSVTRAYDSTILAAHANDTAVHTYRTLTIERGVNGTTAATHADATAISKYAPPKDIERLTRAIVISTGKQESSGWGNTIGGDAGAQAVSGNALERMKKHTVDNFYRIREGAI